MTIPHPYEPFFDWAVRAADQLGVLEQVPDPRAVTWQEWGRRLIEAPALLVYGLPSPDQYDEWADWAQALKMVYPGA